MTTPRIEQIIDLARWAPSGDNIQHWRFEILDDRRFVIHGWDTHDWCVYDLDGRASQIALGTLIENVAIAASTLGLEATFVRRPDLPEARPTIDVTLDENAAVERDVLAEFIQHRVTQRRPFGTTPLTPVQKQRLERSVGPAYTVTWVEGGAARWRMARLLSRSARIRLTIPEAYEVHRKIIEWDTQTSDDRIPDKAVGLDPLGLKLMRWAMASWSRVDFLNRYLGGTWLPRLQLDLLPGYFCGAHFLISARGELTGIDDYLAGGRAVQRFWLEATRQGLQFQPEMTPLIFARYTREHRAFTSTPEAIGAAARVERDLGGILGADEVDTGVFLGRVGIGNYPKARSTRLDMERLRYDPARE